MFLSAYNQRFVTKIAIFQSVLPPPALCRTTFNPSLPPSYVHRNDNPNVSDTTREGTCCDIPSTVLIHPLTGANDAFRLKEILQRE